VSRIPEFPGERPSDERWVPPVEMGKMAGY
jgi:hypothetical protein